jgi:hypothetical protein
LYRVVLCRVVLCRVVLCLNKIDSMRRSLPTVLLFGCLVLVADDRTIDNGMSARDRPMQNDAAGGRNADKMTFDTTDSIDPFDRLSLLRSMHYACDLHNQSSERSSTRVRVLILQMVRRQILATEMGDKRLNKYLLPEREGMSNFLIQHGNDYSTIQSTRTTVP